MKVIGDKERIELLISLLKGYEYSLDEERGYYFTYSSKVCPVCRYGAEFGHAKDCKMNQALTGLKEDTYA